ncbi:MAG TPA: VCBS repeat-containing protein [Candidatus Binatia bacterium]
MRSLAACFFLCIFLSSMAHAQLTWSTSSYPFSSSTGQRADFTGDGFPDLIFFDSTGTTLTVLPNSGDGSFDPTRAFTTSQQGSIALLDFNRDGKTDVAVCDSQNLVVLLGNGDGTLTASRTVPVSCTGVAAADFNHDGNPDIAVTVDGSIHSGDNQIIVYLGDGNGGISGKIVNHNVNFTGNFGGDCFLKGLAQAADFTGDKIPDIAVTAPCDNDVFSDSALIIGVADGTGHFSFHRELATPAYINRFQLGDVNQDNKRDLIMLSAAFLPATLGSRLDILMGNGDGTFAMQTVPDCGVFDASNGGQCATFALADFDGDGTKDLMVVNAGVLQFLKGQLDGTFKLKQSWTLGFTPFLVGGDFNKDGRADLALMGPQSLDVWLNQTTSAPVCRTLGNLRTVNLCYHGSPTGNFHFLATPLDNRQIKSMQIYVAGFSFLKFTTPDDMVNTKILLAGGVNRITAKGWDDLGSFSTTIDLVACTNDIFRTVKICLPKDGSSFSNPVHIVASAATSLPFSQLQVYIDGVVRFHTSAKYVDNSRNLSLGTHRITVKGWDSSGAFSSTVNFTVQ